jgi:hypothetical protein
VSPFTGGAVLPGRPPAPLTDNEPGPEHGRPVRGFVPVVVLVSTPPVVVGSAGETGFSVHGGRSVLLVLGIGLKVIPFCSVVAGFCCASGIVADVVSARTLRPISRVQWADLRATPECVALIRQIPETCQRSIMKKRKPFGGR